MHGVVTNTDLCALLDGEGSPEERQRIEVELYGQPQCSARLAAWRRNDAALRVALCAGPGEAAPAPAPALANPPQRRRSDAAPIEAQDGAALLPARARRASRALSAAAIAAFAGGSGAAVAAIALLALGGR